MTRLLLALVLLASPAIAAPPEPGSEDAQIMQGHGPWIERQRSMLGGFCCSSADGRPLYDNEIRRRDGHWEIYHSKGHWGASGTDTWLPVPPGAVLPNMSEMGFAIAWVMGGTVRCLAIAGAS